jgi:hypothetical protein
MDTDRNLIDNLHKEWLHLRNYSMDYTDMLKLMKLINMSSNWVLRGGGGGGGALNRKKLLKI